MEATAIITTEAQSTPQKSQWLDTYLQIGAAAEMLGALSARNYHFEVRLKGGQFKIFRDEKEIARIGIFMCDPSPDEWRRLIVYLSESNHAP